MMKSNVTRAVAYATLAIGAVMAAASPANAFEPEMMYEFYYYSDASHTTQVGYDRQTCFYWGIGYDQPTQGQWTPYSDALPIATCDHGVLGPI